MIRYFKYILALLVICSKHSFLASAVSHSGEMPLSNRILLSIKESQLKSRPFVEIGYTTDDGVYQSDTIANPTPDYFFKVLSDIGVIDWFHFSRRDTLYIHQSNSEIYEALVWNKEKSFLIESTYNYDDPSSPKYSVNKVDDSANESKFRSIIESWDTTFIQNLEKVDYHCSEYLSTCYVNRVVIDNGKILSVETTTYTPPIDWGNAYEKYKHMNRVCDTAQTDTGFDTDVIRRRALGLPDNPQTSEKDNKDPENGNISKWPFIVIAIITTLIAASLIIYRKRKK